MGHSQKQFRNHSFSGPWSLEIVLNAQLLGNLVFPVILVIPLGTMEILNQIIIKFYVLNSNFIFNFTLTVACRLTDRIHESWSSQRYVLDCNGGRNIIGVINCFLTCFKAVFKRGHMYIVLSVWPRSHVWEAHWPQK